MSIFEVIFALTVSLFILQCLDYYTTRTILKNGGYEQNPAMVKLFALFGADAVLIVKGIAVSIGGYYIGQQSVYALAALVAFYVAIITHNCRSMP